MVKGVDNWLPITGSRNTEWSYSTFHNVTAMVGVGVLDLPSAMVYLGWGAGTLDSKPTENPNQDERKLGFGLCHPEDDVDDAIVTRLWKNFSSHLIYLQHLKYFFRFGHRGLLQGLSIGARSFIMEPSCYDVCDMNGDDETLCNPCVGQDD